jgi:hypothetical protein
MAGSVKVKAKKGSGLRENRCLLAAHKKRWLLQFG